MLSSVHQHVITIFFVIQLFIWCDSCENAVDGFSRDSEELRALLFSGRFVDKSLLIDEILKRDEKVFQITRPLKWGKTVNLQMLKTFFEIEFDQNGSQICDEKKINPSLFKGGEIKTADGHRHLKSLKISEVEDAMKHMGGHPVVSLNLKEVKGNSIAEIEKRIQYVFTELFTRYPFIKKYMHNSSSLLDDDEKERLSNFVTGNLEGEYIFDCLEFLSMILYEHFQSYVCLFIDDYDLPLMNAYLNFGGRGREFKHVVEMFRKIYDYTLKENQYLFKAVITGALNLEIVPSGFSEFEYKYIFYNSVLDKEFSKCYGLLEEELDNLEQHMENINVIEIKKWYGGFFVDGQEFFNLGSVMKCVLGKGKFEYHLINNGNTDTIKFLCDTFLSETLKEDLQLLSGGIEIIRDRFSKSVTLRNIGNDVFSTLVQVGYLSLKLPQHVTEQPVWRMKIPNLEIRGMFAPFFKVLAAKELNITISEYNDFTNLLVTKHVEQFGNKLQALLLHLELFNATKKDEQIYHNLMSSIAASLGLGHLVDSIKELGQNRGEHLIIPLEGYGTCAINIEYTVCTPWQPLQQFVNASFEDMLHRPRHCTSKIRDCQHVAEVLYVAMGFCGQKVILKYKTVNIT